MNVLFVGPYRQKDGWGISSRNWISAMLTNSKINLSTRPIYYINQTENVNDKIIQCENTLNNKYDIVIQKVLPHSLHINKTVKNIGIINVQTQNWKSSRSLILLNQLDEIYVTTQTEKKWLQQSGVSSPITAIPEPFDISVVHAYKPNHLKLPVKNNTFVCYTPFDMSPSSNLETIIQAFHMAFQELDDVALVIFTPNQNVAQSRQHITDMSRSIKNTLRINRNHRNEIVVTINENLNKLDLHNSCSCFLNMSSTTNFCHDTLIAAHLGKMPIVMKHTGLSEIVADSGLTIKSEKTPLLLENSPLPPEYDLFTSNEFWYKPSLLDLIENLKQAYKAHKDHNSPKPLDLNTFSLTTVGSQLCN